jgi:hypothetical protein
VELVLDSLQSMQKALARSQGFYVLARTASRKNFRHVTAVPPLMEPFTEKRFCLKLDPSWQLNQPRAKTN